MTEAFLADYIGCVYTVYGMGLCCFFPWIWESFYIIFASEVLIWCFMTTTDILTIHECLHIRP